MNFIDASLRNKNDSKDLFTLEGVIRNKKHNCILSGERNIRLNDKDTNFDNLGHHSADFLNQIAFLRIVSPSYILRIAFLLKPTASV